MPCEPEPPWTWNRDGVLELTDSEEHGGKKAIDLVQYKPDPVVIKIYKTWPGTFDNSEAAALGFEVDDPKTGFSSAVSDFKELLASS